ncbi:heterokaryon incompatibility protein-domain-containing protein [Dendryphion nanum]|uniref:Heterokaryon incompatibility protein-domain-containing protein n=1 Tax=Dendryphion nanum TaxID=256645 RepID=A0A9P9EK94_9PLEO|nr:heterokaryon incompatibility protein-domain-containing protein [Dendryphion nanum]
MASTWLTACKEQHPLCGIPSPMEMPTRVIDVSTDPPRLFLTNGMSGHYAALSYCWGKVTQMLLKLETLDNFQAKIPFQDMTKTTQDAVIITRSVGIRYLWVDALCIVQNSADDWHSEAAKMKDVYKNALLILNAASAPDAGAGIFPGPDSQNQNFCPIQMLGRNAIEDRTVYMEAVGAGAGFLTDVLRECAVAKRGWCLQESLLSRRTLYFTDQGMLWECASTVEHEDGRSYKFPSKVKSRDTTALYRGSSLMLTRETFENDAGGLRISGSGPSWLHTNDPWKLWDHLVIEYTSRSLTVETDMLTALGGLAEELASVLQCRYHAGLWEKNFVQQMLWTRYKKISVPVYDWDKNQFKPFPFQPKPVSYRAPSWSWAAVNGEPVEYEPINFDEYEMITTTSNSKGRTSTKALRKNIKVKKIFASLVDVQTSLAGKGDYGRIDGGHIILRGNFRTIPSPQYPGRLFASGPIGEYLVAEHYTDAFIDSVPTIATVLEQEFQQQHVPHPNQEFALLEIVRWQVKYGMNPFRSRISSSDKVTFHPLQDYGAYLLVLESVDEEKSAWRRVGLFRVEYTEIGDTKEYAVPANKWQEAYEEVGKKPWEMKDVKIV